MLAGSAQVWHGVGMPLDRSAIAGYVRSGLSGLGGYVDLGGGLFGWGGERPGPGWRAHGVFVVRLWDLVGGVLGDVRIAKQRWFHPESGGTCHRRPPDYVRMRYSSLVIVLALFAWLDSEAGLHVHTPVLDGLDERPSCRTVQRWLRRATPVADAFQHHIRTEILRRCEPRPIERLFPGGLPPPPGNRPWRNPEETATLFRGLAKVLGLSVALDAAVPSHLAEARRRAPTDTWLIR